MGVIRARLFDVDAKCRVASIRACLKLLEDGGSIDSAWSSGVFEDLSVLMVDSKTSVRKEALNMLEKKLLQKLSDDFDLKQSYDLG